MPAARYSPLTRSTPNPLAASSARCSPTGTVRVAAWSAAHLPAQWRALSPCHAPSVRAVIATRGLSLSEMGGAMYDTSGAPPHVPPDAHVKYVDLFDRVTLHACE